MSDDLIKRSDAIKAVNREKSDWNCDYNVPIDNCIKRLNKVKSADRPQGEWKGYNADKGGDWLRDVVGELVRCKECKHNYNKVLNHGKMQPRCDFADWKLTENDYCSRGERRES